MAAAAVLLLRWRGFGGRKLLVNWTEPGVRRSVPCSPHANFPPLIRAKQVAEGEEEKPVHPSVRAARCVVVGALTGGRRGGGGGG